MTKQTWVCPLCSNKLITYVKLTDKPVCSRSHSNPAEMEEKGERKVSPNS